MDEELKIASDDQGQTTPAPAEVQPEPKPEVVPVSDLRALQGVKDREVAAANAARVAAEQRLAALEASMEQLATKTMGADEAKEFIGARRQQSQFTDLQRQAAEGQKYQDIFKMARDNNVPISEFEAVLANPGASYTDAQQIVTGFYQKQLDDLRKQQAIAKTEVEAVARKVERRERATNGADTIGAPAEPTTGSPDLEAQYKKEEAAIIAHALAGHRGQDSALLALRNKYRKLGLDSIS